MSRFTNAIAASVVLATMILVTSCVSADHNSLNGRVSVKNASPSVIVPASESAETVSSEQIYMFRGGFNGVFSTGINDMAAELGKKGITAHPVSWSAANSSMKAIKRGYAANGRSGPIVLVCHSLGCDKVIWLANRLIAEGMPVDLVIMLDPLADSPVPKGVQKLINYYVSSHTERRGDFEPGPGFNGRIVNIDIRTLPELGRANHWNIANQPALQELVVQEIVRVVRRQ